MYKFYLKAVSNAPKVAETLVTNKSIVVLTNKTALSYITKEGAKKHRVGVALYRKILPWTKQEIDLMPQWFRWSDNVVAYSLSRKG